MDSKENLIENQTQDASLKAVWIGLCLYCITSTFSISASQISLGIAFLGTVAAFRKGLIKPYFRTFDKAFAFFAVTGFFSIFNAVSIVRAIVEMKKFLVPLAYFLPVWFPMHPKQRDALAKILIISTSSIALIAIMLDLYRILATGFNYPVQGFFSLTTTFGEFQTLIFIFTLGFIENQKQFFSRPAIFFLLLFQLGGVFLSYCRGAILGLIMGITTMFFKTPKKLIMFAIILIGTTLFTAQISTFFGKSHFLVIKHVDPDQIERGGLLSERLRTWQNGLTIFLNFPIFGIGMNNVKQYTYDLATPFERERNFYFGHLHNSFLQILAMTGFLGLSAFFWYFIELGLFFKNSGVTEVDPHQKKLFQTGIPLIMAFIFFGIPEYAFGNEEIAMLFFFLSGLILNKHVLSSTNPQG
ncbi:MAG: O-antigen ligase family protein [Candidatus Riflebacteria bacterium]|nr:O-antigen ligase family protein [Candidatus Riflebacteria bacterium]